MLLNDFFTINDKVSSATEIWAELFINADHKIFEGHFPNQPVVPGVCMMHMLHNFLYYLYYIHTWHHRLVGKMAFKYFMISINK